MTHTEFPTPDQIDLIIFDLGGVILNIDYQLTQKAFSKIGVPDVERLYSQAAQSQLFDDNETGRISPSEFRKGLKEIIGMEVSDEQLDEAWNALIQEIPPHRVDFILSLKEKFKTSLLSNTNEIHIQNFEQSIDERLGLEKFKSCFDLLCYSSRIGLRKPNVEAWQYVLDKMNVPAHRALFIDDSEQHIVAARSIDVHAVFLKKGQEMSTLLAPLLT